MADGVLQTFPNAFCRDRVEVALRQDRVNDLGIPVACIGRHYCCKLEIKVRLTGPKPVAGEAGFSPRSTYATCLRRDAAGEQDGIRCNNGGTSKTRSSRSS